MNRYNNNNDGPTTINNARLMIQDKPDLILEYTGVEGIGAALKKMFGDEKIPFIAINIPIPGGYWFNLVNKEIGPDTANVVVPRAKAKGWTAADTTVMIMQGLAGRHRGQRLHPLFLCHRRQEHARDGARSSRRRSRR